MHSRKRYRHLLFSALLLTAAGFINAVGVTVFLAPVGLLDGGFSGTSVFLDTLLPLPLWSLLLILNLPFFLFGCRRFGRRFVLTSIYAVSIYAGSTLLIQSLFDVASSSPIAGTDLVLCAIFGGLLSGVGSGMTIHLGGALDGVEILAVTFAKRLGLTVGTFVMLYNCVLFLIAGIVHNAWQIPLYSIIAYTVGIKTIDFIVEGLDKAKAALVITERKNDIVRRCSEELGCGITLLPAAGYYSNREKTVLYIVVNRFEIPQLKRIIEDADPAAFITIIDISDVTGSNLRASKQNVVPPPRSRSRKKAFSLVQTVGRKKNTEPETGSGAETLPQSGEQAEVIPTDKCDIPRAGAAVMENAEGENPRTKGACVAEAASGKGKDEQPDAQCPGGTVGQ